MRHDYGVIRQFAIGVFVLQSTVLAGFSELFHVKPGTEKGGCDDVAADVPAIFDEAALIINAAVEAIHEYRTDFQVRKIALAFFNIQMSDDMTQSREGKDTDTLISIQGTKSILLKKNC